MTEAKLFNSQFPYHIHKAVNIDLWANREGINFYLQNVARVIMEFLENKQTLFLKTILDYRKIYRLQKN